MSICLSLCVFKKIKQKFLKEAIMEKDWLITFQWFHNSCNFAFVTILRKLLAIIANNGNVSHHFAR